MDRRQGTGDAILTIREAARFLKLNDRTVYQLAQRGAIPAVKIGGAWRIHREELDRWIREQSRESCGNKTHSAIRKEDKS